MRKDSNGICFEGDVNKIARDANWLREVKRLERQRQRLKRQGASPSDLYQYFGITQSTSFRKLNDRQFRTVVDNYNKQPAVTVRGNHIYPTRYVRNFNAWFGTNTTQPMRQGYARALQSNFMNDRNLNQLRKRKKTALQAAVNNYADAVENLGDKQLAKKIRKMDNKNFWDFVNGSHGAMSFNNIVYRDKYSQDSQENDFFDEDTIRTLNELYDDFNGERRG